MSDLQTRSGHVSASRSSSATPLLPSDNSQTSLKISASQRSPSVLGNAPLLQGCGESFPGQQQFWTRKSVSPSSNDLSVLRQLDRGHIICWQGEASRNEIEIVEGVARVVRLCESGTRQILTFFWPGTVITPCANEKLSYTIETVTPCLCRSPQFGSINATGLTFGTNDYVLREMIDLLRGISRRCALSRVAWLLLRVREHLPRSASNSSILKFLIPRIDIADYLGLSLETVSRCLTELKERGFIELPNRKSIVFRDRARLERIANG